VLVVRGEAGIGKTALLRYAVEAGSTFRVLRVAGVESEIGFSFAGLHRLVVPLLSEVENLPAPQRNALGCAFGTIEGPAPDRFLVGLATLTLLASASPDDGLLCVVDDAQWLDQESFDLLGFVGRRLYAEGIAMLFAIREPAPKAILEGLPELRLAPLSSADARQLLSTLVEGPLDSAVATTLVDNASGYPLALVELAHELTPMQLAGAELIDGHMHLGNRLEAYYGSLVAALPEPTRLLLLVGAAETSGDADLTWRALTAVGVTRDDAFPAERGGLLLPGGAVEFRHPLIRSAIYTGAPPAEQRRAHQLLADADHTDPDRRAWHLASATLGRDESVAQALEDVARRARNRGGTATVVTSLARAADLTADREMRAERLLSAAEAALLAGIPVTAHTLLNDTAVATTPLRAARAQRLEATALVQMGDMAEAPAMLLAAARAFAPLDVRMHRETLLAAIEAAFVAQQPTTHGTLLEVANTALSGPRPEGPPSVGDLLLDGFSTRIAVGYVEAVPLLQKALTGLLHDDVPSDGLTRWSLLGGMAASDLWDDHSRRLLLRRLAKIEREHGVLNALRTTLRALAACEMWSGRFAASAVLHNESKEISDAISGGAGRWDLLNMELLAWQGREDDVNAAVRIVDEVLVRQRGVGAALNMAKLSTAALALGLGDYARALTNMTEAIEGDFPASGSRTLPDAVEAAVRCGERAFAATTLDRLAVRAAATATPWALGLLARCQALMADDDNVEGLYRHAVDQLSRTSVTTDLARTHLLYGEWLRRQKRRSDARQQLHTAHEMFSEMGAAAFAERARKELVATGARARKRTVDTGNALTPREAQIASLAARGATNPEIAAQLFLSAATVDYHLRHVYQKLAIPSRRYLARVLDDDAFAAGAGT
jgi:DNA-binding CsgD family transcriptional regulator